MEDGYQLGVMAALFTGIVFAFVTTFEGILGKALGAINATVVEHLFAGMLAVTLLGFLLLSGNLDFQEVKPNLPLAALLGLLVFIAVAGIAYSIPKIGFATGAFLLVTAQITTSVIIDAIGIGEFERIPITGLRLLGVVFMGLGAYLVILK